MHTKEFKFLIYNMFYDCKEMSSDQWQWLLVWKLSNGDIEAVTGVC